VICRGGVTGRQWVRSGENHFLDCRVYNTARAEYLGLSSTTDEEWPALARRRGLPDELAHETLFSAASRAAPAAEDPPPPLVVPAQALWLCDATDDWMRR
jgi:hypothetical protein